MKSTQFTSILRNIRNKLDNSLHENIFFLHVPKCGGTSITNALKECYSSWLMPSNSYSFNLDAPASFDAAQKSINQILKPDTINDYPVLKLREELLLYHMSQRHIRYISGHFTFSETAYQNFSNQYSILTILRDPVERWISSYFYNKNRQKFEYRRIKEDLKTYLQSNYGKSQGYEYVKFIGGAQASSDYTSEQSINRAKENLHKFQILGFTEDIDNFADQFKQKFKKKLNIKKLNQAPISESTEKSLITASLRQEIENICSPDLAIYHYARKYFKTDTPKI